MSEFAELKSEQIERIKQRDSFVNLSIVSIGLMISATFSGENVRSPILLAIPWVSMAFGWSFVLNDVKISRLGSYIQRVSDGQSEGPAGWEIWRRGHRRSWLENPATGAIVQFLIFVCPGVVSLIVYFAVRDDNKLQGWEIVACGLGFILLIVLGSAIVTAARVRSSEK